MKNINIDEEFALIECEDGLQECLKNLGEGNNICDVEYPNFRDIEVKIIGLDLTTPQWKPIHVKILESGLQKEVQVSEEVPGWGFDGEPRYEMVTKQVPVTDEWVNIQWLKNYRNSKNKGDE